MELATTEIQYILSQLGIDNVNNGASTGGKWLKTRGEEIHSYSPVDGNKIASVHAASEVDYEAVILKAHEAFQTWRTWPAPKRGEVIRQLAEKIREYKEPLGKLVSYEMGKSLQEGLGEVQEMIDILILPWDYLDNFMVLPCIPSALVTACTNSTIPWELLELFLLLIFL